MESYTSYLNRMALRCGDMRKGLAICQEMKSRQLNRYRTYLLFYLVAKQQIFLHYNFDKIINVYL